MSRRPFFGWRLIWLVWDAIAAFLLAGVPAPWAIAENVLRNPSFEEGVDREGTPAEWQWSGDTRLVKQSLSVDRGSDGRQCAKLECTRFDEGSQSSHAMICQMNLPVQGGKYYRVSFLARAEGLAAEIASIGLSDTSDWSDTGLRDAFAPTPDWRRHEFIFQVKQGVSPRNRFQIWFTSTGTLWLDDFQFVEIRREEAYRPGQVIPAAGRKNLVPNASFECGTHGWGSAEGDAPAHWGGRLNRLVGELDTREAVDGQCSLRIDLAPESLPVSYFDYYDLTRQPILAPLAGNQGFLAVEPGRQYTFSVWMKAADEGTVGRLVVRAFEGGGPSKLVRLARQWQRHSLSFTATSRWYYVLAGGDLGKLQEPSAPRTRATVWLDAVQLEEGEPPTDFAPRDLIEFGLSTDKLGNVFFDTAATANEPLRFRLAVSHAGRSQPCPAKVDLRLTDFFDQEVWRGEAELTVPAMGRIEQELSIPPGPPRQGFLRLHVRLTAGDVSSEQTMRLARLPQYVADDARFGMNHAYPWPHLLDLCREAGLLWMRDWSLKWKDVEPEKGRFTFTEPDYQIDRPLGHGLKVLGLVPFPSSEWSSSAGPEVAASTRYPDRLARVALEPRDEKEFENFVEKTVQHYRGRIAWWQVFNEPLYTKYSLPPGHGYDGTTYARWVKAFARAARRADPNCRILAGIGGLDAGQQMQRFEQFFAAGGLEVVDAVDIHQYPRLRAPEYLEDLLGRLNALMDKHGRRKPLWLTEHGYYADDEPSSLPMSSGDGTAPALASEQLQAEYEVRLATIMFANGVDKVFYHAGTSDGLNTDSLQGVFFEYGGTPHKVYAAQAVMAARVFSPDCRFVKRLALGEGIRAYLFQAGSRLAAVVWAERTAQPKPIRLGEKIELTDIMGRPQSVRRFTPDGTLVYLFADGISVEAFEGAFR